MITQSITHSSILKRVSLAVDFIQQSEEDLSKIYNFPIVYKRIEDPVKKRIPAIGAINLLGKMTSPPWSCLFTLSSSRKTNKSLDLEMEGEISLFKKWSTFIDKYACYLFDIYELLIWS